MTTFSQIVTVLGAVGGIGMLAVMAGGPLLLDLPQRPGPQRRRHRAPRTPAPPTIPQQRRASDAPVEARSTSRL